MTRVCVYRKNHITEIEVSGHAEYAETGKDIVCSAVSTLCYTMLDWVRNSYDIIDFQNRVNETDGYFYLRAIPRPGSEDRVEPVLDAISNGWKLIADAYPDHVTFKEKVGGK